MCAPNDGLGAVKSEYYNLPRDPGLTPRRRLVGPLLERHRFFRRNMLTLHHADMNDTAAQARRKAGYYHVCSLAGLSRPVQTRAFIRDNEKQQPSPRRGRRGAALPTRQRPCEDCCPG